MQKKSQPPNYICRTNADRKARHIHALTRALFGRQRTPLRIGPHAGKSQDMYSEHNMIMLGGGLSETSHFRGACLLLVRTYVCIPRHRDIEKDKDTYKNSGRWEMGVAGVNGGLLREKTRFLWVYSKSTDTGFWDSLDARGYCHRDSSCRVY
ncbi:hypothetical protein K440DRAFT_284089 [Wilcoxina mikolae CBS 423.85]|nr:hypothetical protein K440DRAFT_284089 [Wilcoxina mikolae CBS 423.85]